MASGTSQGTEFVTRDWGRDMSAVRHGALISCHHLAWPCANRAIFILTTMAAPSTSLGCLLSCRVIPRWKETCAQFDKNINVTSPQHQPVPVKYVQRMREVPATRAPAMGQVMLLVQDGGRKQPCPEMSSVCVLIFAFPTPYFPAKQEPKALYCFKARNWYNKVSSPPETHLGRNVILCSYLRINFHCFLSVVEQELLARRGEINIHLEAGVLRDFPAVWTAAKWAVEGFCDGCIEEWALSLFCPDTKQKKRNIREWQ